MSKTEKRPFMIKSTHWIPDSGISEGVCCLCYETLFLDGDDFCEIGYEPEHGGVHYAHKSCALDVDGVDDVESPAADADSDEIWEGSREQLHKALDFLEVVAEKSLWFVAMKVEGAPPEREFRVRRATPDEVAS